METQVPKTQKQKIHEAHEILDAVGHERESEGIKWTKYFVDQWDQREWSKNQLKKEQLTRKRKFRKLDYYRAISGMLQDEIKDLDIPAGYTVHSEFSGDGVIIRMTDRWGHKYYRAFTPDGTPDLDFKVVVTLLVNVLDQIDKLEYESQNLIPNKNGLILT